MQFYCRIQAQEREGEREGERGSMSSFKLLFHSTLIDRFIQETQNQQSKKRKNKTSRKEKKDHKKLQLQTVLAPNKNQGGKLEVPSVIPQVSLRARRYHTLRRQQMVGKEPIIRTRRRGKKPIIRRVLKDDVILRLG